MHRSVTFIGVAAAIIVAANLPARCLGDEPAATDLAAQTADLAAQPGASTPTIDFVRDVRPILAQRCAPCHEPGGRMYSRLPFDAAGTIRDHREGVLRRIKELGEHATIEAFLDQPAQQPSTDAR